MDDELADRLTEWAAEARAADAAAERARRRWLEQQAAEDVSLDGMLLDLAERRSSAAVVLRNGSTRVGVVAAVGSDFVALRGEGGEGGDTTLIPLAAVSLVRTPEAVAGAGREEAAGEGLALAHALARLAGERPRVRVEALGGAALTGELAAAGGDVVVVGLDGGDRASACVPLAALCALTLV
ncbi:MAG TPA: hypothetical protein VGO92_11890 [Acidimicrobiales bacterium]|nr:hypothetical protein [Acidimicrobiales bacterium]